MTSEGGETERGRGSATAKLDGVDFPSDLRLLP